MVKAVRYDEFGGIDVLRVDEVELPVPGDRQVLVRVKAGGQRPRRGRRGGWRRGGRILPRRQGDRVHERPGLPGETVVISGAAGGVGSLAVQLARRTGATVIGLASESNHEWLKGHGVIPVAYGDGVADRIRAAARPAPSSNAAPPAARSSSRPSPA